MSSESLFASRQRGDERWGLVLTVVVRPVKAAVPEGGWRENADTPIADVAASRATPAKLTFAVLCRRVISMYWLRPSYYVHVAWKEGSINITGTTIWYQIGYHSALID